MRAVAWHELCHATTRFIFCGQSRILWVVFVKKLISFLCRLFMRLVLLCVFLVLVGVLYISVFQVPVPERVLRGLLERVDAPEIPFLLEVRRADFSLQRLNLHDVKVVEKGSLNTACLTAKRVTCHLTPALSRDLREWVSRVSVDRLSLPGIPECLMTNTAGALPPATLPETLRPLELELSNANVFGIPFGEISARLTTKATRVEFARLAFTIDNFGQPDAEHAEGALRIDLAKQTIVFSAEGRVSAAHVDAFLEPLNTPAVQAIIRRIALPPPYPRIEFFIDASYAKDEVALSLVCENVVGAYLGVPFSQVSGRLSYVETNNFYKAELKGFRGFTSFSPARLELTVWPETIDIEASATLPLADINVLAENVFPPEQLAPLASLGPVTATANGRIDINTNNAFRAMNFRGAFSAESGRLFNLPFAMLSGRYSFVGPRIVADSITLVTPGASKLTGDLRVDLLPEPGRLSSTFHVSRFLLAELMPLFSPTNAPTSGELQGTFTFTSALDTPRDILHATGGYTSANARIARFPLFAGFTEFMAQNIPGVNWLTQQTSSEGAFTITSNTLHLTKLAITGEAFTILGKGDYDIDDDALNLTFQSHMFADRTLLGSFAKLIASPVNYLLLTFHVTGPRDNPRWVNVGVVSRVGRAVSSLFFDSEPKAEPQK